MNIIQGILNKLDESYPDIKKETRMAKQGVSPEGVKLPCFFISIIDTELLRHLGDYFLTDNLVNVVYVSDEKDRYILEEMKLDLMFLLEQIKLEKVGLTASEINGKIIDGDLIISARYKLLLEKVKYKNLMKELKQNISIKNNESSEKYLRKPYFKDTYVKGDRKLEDEIEQERIRKVNKNISQRDIEKLKDMGGYYGG